MNKTLITTAVLLLMFVFANAQDGPKGYVSITGGASFPVGDFANKNSENPDAGLASTGVTGELGFSMLVKESKFGCTIALRGSSHAVDEGALIDTFEDLLPGSSWEATSDSWKTFGFFVGAYTAQPVNEKVVFEAKAMIGYVSATSPEMNISGSYQSENVFATIASDNAANVGFALNAGFRFNLTGKVALLANADYSTTKPEFRIVSTIRTENAVQQDSANADQAIGAFALNFGLALRL